MSDALRIDEELSIPRSELEYRATRSGGPGGQHVNTSSTRIELLWNLGRSRALSDAQRALLRDRLAGRLDAESNIRIVASAYRSQARNRDDAEERLVALLRSALVVRRKRRKTRPHRAAVEARLDAKRRRGEQKRSRRSLPGE